MTWAMPGRTAGGSFRLTFGLAVCAAGAVLFLLIRQGSRTLANPEFCATCHAMRAQYVSYRRSAHDRTSCVDCHSGRGCASCHDAEDADRTTSRARVNAPGPGIHVLHARSGSVACMDCHRGLMHARMDGARLKSARAACGDCHPQTELGQGDNRYRMRNPPGPEGS